VVANIMPESELIAVLPPNNGSKLDFLGPDNQKLAVPAPVAEKRKQE